MESLYRKNSDEQLSSIANIYTSTHKSKNQERITDSPKRYNYSGVNYGTNPTSTINSQVMHTKKYSFTSSPTNISKAGSMYSNMSKNPVTNYISCSTLQSGVACYSIPKEKRFENFYRKPICNNIYNLPEYKSPGITMATSKRDKSTFYKKDLTPSSQDYIYTSLFDNNIKHKKGISISTKHSIKVIDYLSFIILRYFIILSFY